MAVLQKIRNRAGILVIIFVGVALFLFIIDPTTFQQLFQKQDTSIAEINGEEVDYKEFDEAFRFHADFLMVAQEKSSLDPEEDERIRTQAWNDILQKYLLEPYFEEIGISVSDAELEDLLYGSNIHYVILQNFTNQQTGAVDTAQIRNFFETAGDDPRFSIISEYWKAIIKKDRLSTKYNNMIGKGFYVPKKMAEMDYNEKNNMCDFVYILRPYKSIPDEDIKITDDDLKKYYDEHQYMFEEAKASRDIEYVVFDVIPSAEDTLATLTEIKEMYDEFNALESGHADYAKRYSEYETDPRFMAESMLPPTLPEGFFNMEAGATTDIIQEGSVYFFSRIEEVAMRPDSVMASHILIVPNDSVSIEMCRAKADSLMNLVKKGADFAALAMVNSEDPGSKPQGGDLGWFTDGMMVPEFNEACFRGKKGDITIAETQFGVHLIKITDQTKPIRKITLATVNKGIHFSDRTANYYFSQASTFAADNTTAKKFDDAIIKQKYVKRIATKLGELDNQISGIENARDIVRWVYEAETKKGDISTVFSFPDKYIVVKVSAVREKGVLPLEDVKETITPIVIKDKKAEKFLADLNKDVTANTDLFAIAEKYGVEVDTVTNASFGSFSLPGIGIEPNLNAVASASEMNKLSKPVKGNNGVYVIKVINQLPAPAKTDFSAEQLGLMRNQASQVYKVVEAVEKMAEITDYRAKYF
jgi:peptidyl-prolyl cis-trans isomerase D